MLAEMGRKDGVGLGITNNIPDYQGKAGSMIEQLQLLDKIPAHNSQQDHKNKQPPSLINSCQLIIILTEHPAAEISLI